MPRKYKRHASRSYTYSKRRRGIGGYSRSCASALSKPPPFEALIKKRHTFRFVSSSAYSGDITAGDIAGALGGICTVANTTLACYNLGFKINSVELWAAGSESTPVQVSLTWGAGDTSAALPATGGAYLAGFLPSTISDTSVGVSQSAHIKAYPPKNSLSGNWFTLQNFPSATVAFGLNVPQGCTIDLNISYFEQSGLDYSDVNVNISNGTLSDIYYLALDGPTSNKLVPINMITTH